MKPAKYPQHCLIGMALSTSTKGELQVGEIYKFIETVFPLFIQSSPATWKNSLRHCLSRSGYFEKVNLGGQCMDPVMAAKKGNRWRIKPEKALDLLKSMEKCSERIASSNPTPSLNTGSISEAYASTLVPTYGVTQQLISQATPLTQLSSQNLSQHAFGMTPLVAPCCNQSQSSGVSSLTGPVTDQNLIHSLTNSESQISSQFLPSEGSDIPIFNLSKLTGYLSMPGCSSGGSLQAQNSSNPASSSLASSISYSQSFEPKSILFSSTSLAGERPLTSNVPSLHQVLSSTPLAGERPLTSNVPSLHQVLSPLSTSLDGSGTQLPDIDLSEVLKTAMHNPDEQNSTTTGIKLAAEFDVSALLDRMFTQSIADTEQPSTGEEAIVSLANAEIEAPLRNVESQCDSNDKADIDESNCFTPVTLTTDVAQQQELTTAEASQDAPLRNSDAQCDPSDKGSKGDLQCSTLATPTDVAQELETTSQTNEEWSSEVDISAFLEGMFEDTPVPTVGQNLVDSSLAPGLSTYDNLLEVSNSTLEAADKQPCKSLASKIEISAKQDISDEVEASDEQVESIQLPAHMLDILNMLDLEVFKEADEAVGSTVTVSPSHSQGTLVSKDVEDFQREQEGSQDKKTISSEGELVESKATVEELDAASVTDCELEPSICLNATVSSLVKETGEQSTSQNYTEEITILSSNMESQSMGTGALDELPISDILPNSIALLCENQEIQLIDDNTTALSPVQEAVFLNTNNSDNTHLDALQKSDHVPEQKSNVPQKKLTGPGLKKTTKDKWITNRWQKIRSMSSQKSKIDISSSLCELTPKGVSRTSAFVRPLTSTVETVSMCRTPYQTRKRPLIADQKETTELGPLQTKRQRMSTEAATDQMNKLVRSTGQTCRKYSRTKPTAAVKPPPLITQKVTDKSELETRKRLLPNDPEAEHQCKRVRISTVVESVPIHVTRKRTLSDDDEDDDDGEQPPHKKQKWTLSTLSPTRIVLRRLPE